MTTIVNLSVIFSKRLSLSWSEMACRQ